MKISSPAFADNGFIPIEYTQEGEDLSPPLVISDIPEAAKSLVLIVEDPDAPDPENPKLIFTHWIVYNLPPKAMELTAGQAIDQIPGASEGLNDRGTVGYIGPRPPIGVHRYFFKLYALNTELSFERPPQRKEILREMDGRVVGSAQIIGLYKLLR